MKLLVCILASCLFSSIFAWGQNGRRPLEQMHKSEAFLVRDTGISHFNFKNLEELASSKAGLHGQMTLELSSSPVWFAIEALPSLMQPNAPTTDQLMNSYYACTMAGYLLQKYPEILEWLTKWDFARPEHKIAAYFDTLFLKNIMERDLAALEKSQLPDGSWPWLPGMKPSLTGTKGDRKITGLICAGIGRLEDMHIYNDFTDRVRNIGIKAFTYLDSCMVRDYNAIIKSGGTKNEAHLTEDMVTYLYVRTYWKVALDSREAKPFYFWMEQAYNHTDNCNLMEKAMLVSALFREDDEDAGRRLWHTIDAASVQDKETGIYWKENIAGPGLMQQPTETVCMLVEAYNKVLKTNMQPIEEMEAWLLRQRQGMAWATNLATVDVFYALMQRKKPQPLETNKDVMVTIGLQARDLSTQMPGYKGSGYFCDYWPSGHLKDGLNHIEVISKSQGVEYGVIDLQYEGKPKEERKFELPVKFSKDIVIDNTAGAIGGIYGQRTAIGNMGIIIDMDVKNNLDYVCISSKVLSGYGLLVPPIKCICAKFDDSLVMTMDSTTNEDGDSSISFYFDHLAKGKYSFIFQEAAHDGNIAIDNATINNVYAPKHRKRARKVEKSVQ